MKTIDSSHLRIGNLVFDRKTKTECTVDSIELGGDINTSDPKYDYGERTVETDGIPVTAEWLEKFGFVKRIYKMADPSFEKTYSYAWGDGTTSDEIFSLEHFNEAIFLFPDHRPTIKIEYIHQLQNLYFALIGEELELTTEKQSH